MPFETLYFKAAKISTACSHTHPSKEDAATCPELGAGPGVIMCLGPGGVLRHLSLRPADPEDTIILPIP